MMVHGFMEYKKEKGSKDGMMAHLFKVNTGAGSKKDSEFTSGQMGLY